MYSRAGSMPPMSSTIRSLRSRMSSKSPRERVRTPDNSGRMPTEASIDPARSSSNLWNAPPTVPWPSSPTLNAVTSRQVLVGLAPDDDARLAGGAEDDGRARDRVVVVRHRVAVGAGGRDDQHVARLRVVQHDVAHEDVAGLAVHPGDRAELLAAGPVGDVRLVLRAVEHRTQVVRHPPVDRDVGAHTRDLLDRPDGVGRHPGVPDQRPTRL